MLQFINGQGIVYRALQRAEEGYIVCRYKELKVDISCRQHCYHCYPVMDSIAAKLSFFSEAISPTFLIYRRVEFLGDEEEIDKYRLLTGMI